MSASYKDGMLTLQVAKTKNEAPNSIEVKVR
jgi:HSP20 family molecular chaperone IbpA